MLTYKSWLTTVPPLINSDPGTTPCIVLANHNLKKNKIEQTKTGRKKTKQKRTMSALRSASKRFALFPNKPLFGNFCRSYSAFGAKRMIQFLCVKRYWRPSSAKEEASKWKKFTLLGLTIWGLGHVAILSMAEHEPDRKQFAHMFVLHKDFPWRDGKTPLFGDAAARHEQHKHAH